MKNLIATALLLAALVAGFSIYGERVPFERAQNEGWVVFGGTSGDPIPCEGADGKMDVFAIGNDTPQEMQPPVEQTTADQAPQKLPVTVSVKYPETGPTLDWRTFFTGVAAGVLVAHIAMAAGLAILFWLDRKQTQRRHRYGKN